MSEASHESSVHSCTECHAALAYDQRYCVNCGARRGALPFGVAGTIAGILEQGRPVPAPRGPAAGPDPAPTPAARTGWTPTPRATAVAVLSMLGFGVIVGSTVGAGAANVLSNPLILVEGGAFGQSSGAGAGASGSGSGGAGGGGGVITETITESTPAPAAAPQQAQSGLGSGSVTTTPGTNTSTGSSNLLGLPPVKHFFLIVLSDRGYKQSFGSKDPYFSKTLPKQGNLLQYYYAIAGGELANGIGLISGQGPTVQTAGNCPVFSSFTATDKGTLGQDLGSGCVYPTTTPTLAGQLSAPKQGGWKAYIEGVDQGPKGTVKACRHPALGAKDANQAPGPKDPYVTWRNPFVYLHAVSGAKSCQQDDVGLPRLATDLKTVKTTPALSYIAPSACDDGSDQPCRPGAPSGLGPADTFLKTVLAEIEKSPAYKADGAIAITFDQAPQTGPLTDPSACCDPQTFPNLPATTTGTTTTPAGTTTTPAATTPPAATSTTPATTTSTPAATGTTTTPAGTTTTTTSTSTSTTPASTGGQTNPTGGGGQVGLLLISQYVKPNTVDLVDYYNHFSLLASIENLFGLKRLGYAGDLTLPVFDQSTFNAGAP